MVPSWLEAQAFRKMQWLLEVFAKPFENNAHIWLWKIQDLQGKYNFT